MSDDTPPSIDMPIMFQLVRNNDALRAENERLREALTALVRRLDEIADDPDFKTMQTVFHTHGFKYGGPSWAEPLKAAHEALSPALDGDRGCEPTRSEK